MGDWDVPAMVPLVLGVCALLCGLIFAGEIADAVRRWRER